MTRFWGVLALVLATGCSGAEDSKSFDSEDVTGTDGAGIQSSTTTGTEGGEVTGSTTGTTASASTASASTSSSSASTTDGAGGGAGEASTETSSTSAGGSGTTGTESTTGEATTGGAGGTTSTDTASTADTASASTSSSTTGAPPGPDACNPPAQDHLVQSCCGACEGVFDEQQLGCVECGSACSLGEFESDEQETRSFVFDDGCSSQHLSVASERVDGDMLCTKLWSAFPGWVLDTHSTDEVYSHGEVEEFSDTTGSSYRDCVVVGSTDSEVSIKADRSASGASWLTLQRGDCDSLSCD